MGNLAIGSCERAPIYLVSQTRPNRYGTTSTFRIKACAQHAGAHANRHGLDLPAPVRVVVRGRDDGQQLRDAVARLTREVRALRQENQQTAELITSILRLPPPGQRSLRLGEDPGEHRQRLWGDVRQVGG